MKTRQARDRPVDEKQRLIANAMKPVMHTATNPGIPQRTAIISDMAASNNGNIACLLLVSVMCEEWLDVGRGSAYLLRLT